MGARGKKTGSQIVAQRAAVMLMERPKPPLDLTPAQSDEWVEIVNSLPADWFSPENYPLLAQYCRHIVNARHTAQLIDQAESSSPEMDVHQYLKLLAAQHKQTAALKALAASMRFAQQARYDAQKAAVKQRSVGTVKRPWES